MSSYKCIFQGLSLPFQKSCTSKRVFHKTAIFIEHVWVAVSVFCVSCELKNSKSSRVFFNFLQPTITNLVIFWKRLMRLIVLHCAGISSRQLHVSVNNRKTRTRCEICSKLTKKTPEKRQWCRSGGFIANFEQISHLVLVFVLLTLTR